MYKVVVIGGGWAGCAAAIAARKAGADVTLLEKTDMLLGLGNVGGIMRNNGRFTAAEENIALGAGDLFGITDRCSRHINVDFPGHEHASLYDVTKVEPEVRRLIKSRGIEIRFMTRAVDVIKRGDDIEKLILAGGEELEGDVFIETTGSTGGPGNCLTYGNGCCMCILRCPAFGPRVSISAKAGGRDIMGQRKDGSFGAFSGSGKLEKASLSEEIRQALNEKGVAVVPLPRSAVKKEKLDMKVCRQYALDEFAENIVLLDTGYAKIMTPFFDLETLRQIPGFENARYVDPYAGGKGNSIRYLSVAERDDSLKVSGVGNLFCGGEKAGLFVGHTEAISTGSLAGHNAVRFVRGMKPLQLPTGLAIGDLISFAGKSLESAEGLMTRFTFAGAEYFERMKEKDLYSIDPDEIRRRVRRYGLEGIYEERLM
ncbi:MAG: FAD-dependent oxidoreductase [Firmicutes bacterium]|nr:FAD-dependent oxidoreductase [Bacillota bacterium]MBR3787557.1 FAD-dependent oxidoreductase [Bacillota bacterium]